MQRVHGDPPLTLVLYIKLYTITPHTKNKTIAIGLFFRLQTFVDDIHIRRRFWLFVFRRQKETLYNKHILQLKGEIA